MTGWVVVWAFVYVTMHAVRTLAACSAMNCSVLVKYRVNEVSLGSKGPSVAEIVDDASSWYHDLHRVQLQQCPQVMDFGMGIKRAGRCLNADVLCCILIIGCAHKLWCGNFALTTHLLEVVLR